VAAHQKILLEVALRHHRLDAEKERATTVVALDILHVNVEAVREEVREDLVLEAHEDAHALVIDPQENEALDLLERNLLAAPDALALVIDPQNEALDLHERIRQEKKALLERSLPEEILLERTEVLNEDHALEAHVQNPLNKMVVILQRIKKILLFSYFNIF